jgi:hypothetical protein
LPTLDPDQLVTREIFYGYFPGKMRVAAILTKPIRDKAEVAVEYSDKLYIGTFAHTARFDAHTDETGIALALELPASDEKLRREIHDSIATQFQTRSP